MGELERALERLKESEERFAKLFEASPAKIAIGTMDGRLVDVNRAYADFFGFAREEMVGRSVAELGIVGRDELSRLLALGGRPGPAMRDVEVAMRHRDGRVFDVLMSADVITVAGKPHRVATLVDVTERKRLESQLAQAQRMDSIGRLAGGVAHDFNNILTAIAGYAKFLVEDLAEGDRRREDAREVARLTERAARLTGQLLAFSRRQLLVPEVFDANVMVADTARMLERVIGEDIEVRAELADRPCLVRADAAKLEQVLLNLALNARDAMPEGGTLTFATRGERPVRDFSARHPDLRPGPLVRITVRDTGVGMTDDVKARAFEPFFTTKAKGQGTGLGLSMAYGVVKQSGGALELESRPGAGTTLEIFLPCEEGEPNAGLTPADAGQEARPGGPETVLLVEDEEAVRRVAERMLAAAGYRVLTAADGAQALDLLSRRGEPVELLLTDVVMPGMGGRELARRAAQASLARRVLYMSGYTDDPAVRQGVLRGAAFLEKPFTRESLLRKVRETLDGRAGLVGS